MLTKITSLSSNKVKAIKSMDTFFNNVTSNDAVLIVDLENEYLSEDYLLNYTSEDIDILYTQDMLTFGFDAICEYASGLNHEVDFYLTCYNEDIYDGLNLNDIKEVLPQWNTADTDLPLKLVDALKKYNTVYVCGLWRERCVYTVASLLDKYEINSVIVDHPSMTLSAAEHLGHDDEIGEDHIEYLD